MASTSEPRPPSAAAPLTVVEAPSDAEVVQSDTLGKRFFNLRTLGSFVLAVGLLAFFVTRLDLDFEKVMSHLRSVNLGLFGLAIVLHYASFPLRGLRWHVLLRNAG